MKHNSDLVYYKTVFYSEPLLSSTYYETYKMIIDDHGRKRFRCDKVFLSFSELRLYYNMMGYFNFMEIQKIAY